MEDPSLELLEAEGPQLAKLASSSFSNLADYEEVLNDARDLVQLMMGAMGINQDPGPLQIVNVIGWLWGRKCGEVSFMAEPLASGLAYRQ